MLSEKITNSTRELSELIESLNLQSEEMGSFAQRIVEAFHQERRLFFLGVGPLGALADLAASRFLHRLSLERPPLPAFSLNRDTSFLSGLEGDGLGDEFFSRQLRVLASGGDIVLIMANNFRDGKVQEALCAARELGCFTAMLAPAREEPSGDMPDLCFRIDCESTGRLAEVYLFFGQMLCELVEAELFGI